MLEDLELSPRQRIRVLARLRPWASGKTALADALQATADYAHRRGCLEAAELLQRLVELSRIVRLGPCERGVVRPAELDPLTRCSLPVAAELTSDRLTGVCLHVVPQAGPGTPSRN